jgi:ribosome-binding factor A
VNSDGFRDSSVRVQKVEKELQHLLSEYLTRNLRFSTLTTILRVESNKELRAARVFVSVFGDDDAKAAIMERLEAEIYQIQGFINRELHMKHPPRIRFVLDHGLDHMAHVQEVIDTFDAPGDKSSGLKDET